MFSSIRNTLLQKRTFFFPQSHLITTRFISTNSPTPKNPFTISYLINSCGLSQQTATQISKNINFDSSTNPDSVLNLLKENGFSNSHISKLTSVYPLILTLKGDTNLKPKFEFFKSVGLSGDELAKVLSRDPIVLGSSLEKTIIPSFDFLKRIVGTDDKVRKVLKSSMGVIPRIKRVESNIEILRLNGVPMSNIVKALVSEPRVFLRGATQFSEIVDRVKRMKVDPLQYTFFLAIRVLNGVSKSCLEAKFDVYKSWGWSEDQVELAFRKNPNCMKLSIENIMSSMEFLVTKMGYDGSSLANRSIILQYSLEKRIIPRCSVIQVLIKKGCVEKPPSIQSVVQITEDVFLKCFVTKFEKTVPGLLNFYRGKSQGYVDTLL